ncbi:MAG: DNA mismatch repair protein MutS [Bacteroidota bacterium]
MLDPRSIFEYRVQANSILELQLKLKSERWTLIRGVIFVLAFIITYFAAKNFNTALSILVFFVSFSGFLFTVNTHLKIKIALKKVKLLIGINRNELSRLSNDFTGMATGVEFSEKSHFYASDLDLFGEHSLYQLLNRCHTFEGAQTLSDWMKTSAAKTEILERQKALTELSGEIDFRQNLEVTALESDTIGEPTSILLEWIQYPENEKIKKSLFRFGQYLPIVTLGVLIGAIFGFYSYWFVALLLLIHGILLKLIDEDISNALKQTEPIGDTLKAYSALMQLIVERNFANEKLKVLVNKVKNAPKAVSDLQKNIHFLSYRSNPVAALGGIILMQDLRNFSKLEKWKAENRDNLAVWLEVVHEFEALNSLAGYQFANPNYAIPEISEETILLNAKELGHPLISVGKRVFNDFEISGTGKTIILTGSNMSGKSTFERTVGINLVLASMGAVVCAQSFECAEMQLFTSMRTQDSLESETSSFYAELKRLELLIQLTNQPEKKKPIFYLLDEILKGTNSKDRHTGAKALILQLKNKIATGIISTHDVELGDEFEGMDFIKNLSFSSEITESGLFFDYKIKQGVCHSFNASELMRRIGIEIETT